LDTIADDGFEKEFQEIATPLPPSISEVLSVHLKKEKAIHTNFVSSAISES